MENENTMDLGDLLESRIMENYASDQPEKVEVSDERLKEMNKKLPSWSLEPTFGFLK